MGGSGGGGDVLPLVVMVAVQLGYAGMNIIVKLALEEGVEPVILIAYRQLLASIVIAPFAYFLERKTWPRLKKQILFYIFLSSLFGASINQVLYFIGLKNSTATVACAITNLLPATTFVLAVFFRLESVGIKRRSGQAKVLGTLLCVGGAMLLTFYHGHTIGVRRSGIRWKYSRTSTSGNYRSSSAKGSSLLASFLLLVSMISFSMWFILQAKIGEKFASPYTINALTCFMASIECLLAAACSQHKAAKWSLASSPIKLLATLYAGIVSSALTFSLTTWTIQKKGPLYASVFSPLLLIIVAILSWALLNEQIYMGTVVGSFLIMMGLYIVLWGKKEKEPTLQEVGKAGCVEDQTEATHDEKEQPHDQGVELI